MQQLAVIGLGSAGIQTLCHMLSWLYYDQWRITSIHNPDVPSLGIGESTNPPFIAALQTGIDFDISHDLKHLHGTFKFGTMFKDWREHDFINPLLHGSAAIHFDTHALKDFAIPRLKQRWGDKFKIIEGNVDEMVQTEDVVNVTVDSKEHAFDFVIDCRGFPESFDDYNVLNGYVNRALVVNSPQTQDWTYTGHRATKNGWTFEVPLDHRTSYGYMYNSNITSREKAIEDFGYDEELIANEFKFKTYYAKNVINNRIAVNGNRALFFEPMFANSLWMYDNINRSIIDLFQGAPEESVNAHNNMLCTNIKEMLDFHYHGGSIFDTDFWKISSLNAQTELDQCENFEIVKDNFKNMDMDRQCIPHNAFSWIYPPWALRQLDINFGYNYFN